MPRKKSNTTNIEPSPMDNVEISPTVFFMLHQLAKESGINGTIYECLNTFLQQHQHQLQMKPEEVIFNYSISKPSQKRNKRPPNTTPKRQKQELKNKTEQPGNIETKQIWKSKTPNQRSTTKERLEDEEDSTISKDVSEPLVVETKLFTSDMLGADDLTPEQKKEEIQYMRSLGWTVIEEEQLNKQQKSIPFTPDMLGADDLTPEQKKEEIKYMQSLGWSVSEVPPFPEEPTVLYQSFPLADVNKTCVKSCPKADLIIVVGAEKMERQICAVVDTGADLCAGPYREVLALARDGRLQPVVYSRPNNQSQDRIYIRGDAQVKGCQLHEVMIMGLRGLDEWVIGRQGILNNSVFMFVGSNISGGSHNVTSGIHFVEHDALVLHEVDKDGHPDVMMQELKEKALQSSTISSTKPKPSQMK